MGNSQSFDDDTYGKDSLFAETEESSIVVNDYNLKPNHLLKSKEGHIVSRTSADPAKPWQHNQTTSNRFDDPQQRGQDDRTEKIWYSPPDELSDRDELTAMTDMAWKHLSNRMRSLSNTVEVINADEEYSLRQSRDDDSYIVGGRLGVSYNEVRPPNTSYSLRDNVDYTSTRDPSRSCNAKKIKQSGSTNKKSDQDKYSVRTYSAEDSFTILSYNKDALMEPPPSPESFFGFGGIWGNDSIQSTKSDHSPVYSPRSPGSPPFPRRNETKPEISARMEYITSRLDAMTESQISQSIQAEKIVEHETIQESLDSILLSPNQRKEEWDIDAIYARLDELTKTELVMDDPTERLTADTMQETTIHEDDEIKIEGDSAIEVQKVNRYTPPLLPVTMKNDPPLSPAESAMWDRTNIMVADPVDQTKDNHSQQHDVLDIDGSVDTRSALQSQINKAVTAACDDARQPDQNVASGTAAMISPRKTALIISASPIVHTDNTNLLITEDFLDKCGNFVTNLIENPLASPCNAEVLPACDNKTVADLDCSVKSNQPTSLVPTDNACRKEADALVVEPEMILRQNKLSEGKNISAVVSSDPHSNISEEPDIDFVQKYAELFEKFLTANIDLIDQNPDMVSFLYVAKLTKIMEASEKLESAFKKRIAKLKSDKDSVLSRYREDLIEAAKEKVVKGIQHEQDLKVLQETGRVMEGKMKWKLLMENASRARHESMLLRTLWKTTMDAETPLEYLPNDHEMQQIREAAVACQIETPESQDILLKELRRYQIENNFLNTEVSVLEGKLSQRKQEANAHLWVDSVFRRLGKSKKAMTD